MNEERHPREVMCVPEANLICSRIGHSLFHQHIMIPAELLYVTTSTKKERKDHCAFPIVRSIPPLSVILTTVQIHFPCKAGNVLGILVKVAGDVAERVSPVKWGRERTETQSHQNTTCEKMKDSSGQLTSESCPKYPPCRAPSPRLNNIYQSF